MAQVSLLNRGVARGIDLALALAVAAIVPRAGWLAAVLYILVADGISGGQSLGKRFLGLMVIGPEGGPCGIKDSILRNILFGAGVLLWVIPVIGWLLLAAAVVVELLVLMGSGQGIRLGDELAGTRVVEAPQAEGPGEDSGDKTGDDTEGNGGEENT
jgi:uncharacterized RDD family membrane protein YckC